MIERALSRDNINREYDMDEGINLKAALMRFLSGLGIFLLEATRGFVQGYEFSDWGPWAALAGLGGMVIVTVLGMVIKKFGDKPPA